ncbi:hypothetical protein KAR34_07055 [bacterium]|nr:hypothetical protein [bacterium]
MIEDAQAILDYLPSYYCTEKEQEYLPFLWDAFVCNYENKKYQFSFLAYHMSFMMFVYFSIWKIKSVRPDCFQKALIGFGKDIENKLLNSGTPFSLSELNERSILRFFKLIGFDNGQIGQWHKIIDQRNDVAHSNGNIFFESQEQLDEKITQILDCVAQIQNNMKEVLFAIFARVLSEEEENFEHFQEVLLRQNYFSQQDMKMCLEFNFNSLAVHGKKKLIGQIKKQYVEAYNNEDE